MRQWRRRFEPAADHTTGLTQEYECGMLSGRVWAAPTLVGDQLFLRAGKKLTCCRLTPAGNLKNSLDSRRHSSIETKQRFVTQAAMGHG